MTTAPPAFTQWLGGEPGRHARSESLWLRADPWAYLGLVVSWLVLFWRQLPCQEESGYYPGLCYSDIRTLFYSRGIGEGRIPYLEDNLEYPVLTGALIELNRRIMMWLGGPGAPGLSDEELKASEHLFFNINAVLLFAMFVVVVWAHLRLHRPWDALMIAVAPAIWTAGLINWDGLVVALTALAILAWARRSLAWTGIWLGLGIAAKLYPILLLVPLGALCLRTGRWREYFTTVGGTLAAWTAVNLPVYLASPNGWLEFWTFSAERDDGLSSLWYILGLTGHPVDGLSRLVAVLMVVGALALIGFVLLTPTRPRLASGIFLMVAWFLLVNKVYSPQYVLWLLPLLVLARPRWLDWALFSIAEAIHFVAIWTYLAGRSAAGDGNDRLYWLAVLLRMAVLVWLCVQVVRDSLTTERDLVRADGLDDPDGGIFDQAQDAKWLAGLRSWLGLRSRAGSQ